MLKEENQSWLGFFIEIIVLISIVLFIRFYVFQLFRVSGPSMCPTLNVLNEECQGGKGEFIFVNEFLYKFMKDPKRGEIVIFRPPNKKIYYVKRVIGIAGDTIEIENGKVYLTNSKVTRFKLQEDFLSEKNKGRTKNFEKTKFTVPEGHFLLFGDNRDKSLDARQCFSGAGCNGQNTPFVSKENIQGRAEFVIWPFWKSRWLENHPEQEDLKKKETIDS